MSFNQQQASLFGSRLLTSSLLKQLIPLIFLMPAVVVAQPVENIERETVTLQLKYYHQFQFAGYYAALEKGFYGEVGLDVKIKANDPSLRPPIDEVLSGAAQYGVADMSLVAERLAGKPVVVLANVFQKSPIVWIVLEDSGIAGLHDLVGKSVMHSPGLTSELLAMLQVEGIPASMINLVPTSFNLQDLIDGHIDAFNGYTVNEPYILQEQGIPYRLISPIAYGIDSYGDVLFTSESEISEHPERAKNFRLASLKGWRYAMDHPDEIIDLIRTKYNSQKSLAHFKFEAEGMRDLILPDLVTIGFINPGRWRTIAERITELGSTEANYDLLEGFIYDPNPKPQDLRKFYTIITLVTLVALLLLGLAIWIGLLNTKLKKSEQGLNEAQRIAHLGSWEWDITTNLITWSDELCRIYGMEPDKIEPSFEGFLALLSEDTKTRVTDAVDNALSGKAEYDIEFPIILENGEERIVRAQGVVIRDQDGKPLRMIGSTQDNTERNRAEQLLRKSEKYNRMLFQESTIGLALCKMNGELVDINPAFASILGRTLEEAKTLSYWNITPEKYAVEEKEQLNILEETGRYGPYEKEYIHADGHLVPVRLSGQLLKKDGSKFIWSSVEDITERKQAEDEKEYLQRELQQSQKMEALGKLTGGIAHEYNNMLAIITGYSELLKKALMKQPELLKYTNEIQRAGNRAAVLTSKLLTFSRQKPSEPESINLNELLQKQHHMLEKTLTVRIKLIFNLQQDLWHVWLDEGDMEDAILNMSINAMHAIAGNGQLTVQTNNQKINKVDAQSLGITPGDYVLLSFTDSGCGMNQETKEKIFEPFFTTKGDEGTGLGLSMVYGFVKNSGGFIKVYSELGQGTQFTLYFPRYPGSRSVQKLVVDSPIEAFNDKKTILVVDDEPSLLSLTDEILSSHGAKVFCAESAKEALNLLQHEAIDIMISDVIMPEMDGYQLAAIVKEKYPEIKIQLASGFTDDRHAGMVDEELHNNVLHKPFSSQELLSRIRELC